LNMRAIAVEKLKGEPRLLDVARPEPKADQLLVKVSMAGMNPIDWKLADGMMTGVLPEVLPFVLGLDAVGIVAGTGASVSRFKIGDRVFGQFFHPPLGEGTYAEYTVVPESGTVAILPSSVSDEVGAALPTAAMTALSIVDSLELTPGSKVLIVGASGGVGSFATQMAVDKGFTVLVTARDDYAERLRLFGAFESFDRRGLDLVSQVALAHPQGIDAVIDLVSDAATFAASASLVSKGGYLVTITGVADLKALKARGLKGVNFQLEANTSLLKQLVALVEGQKLVVPVEATINLDKVPAAIAASRSGRARGKTVIRPG
jgi:NADPH:quinone reductase